MDDSLAVLTMGPSETGTTEERLYRCYAESELNETDWTSASFSPAKACLCCLASQLAYEHIPGFELANTDRCSIVPCESYFEKALFALKNDGFYSGIADSLVEGIEEPFGVRFIIQSPLLIVVGIRLGKVALIALRGTELGFNIFALPRTVKRSALDLKADLDFRQKVYHNQHRYRFDQGFYDACDPVYELVRAEVAQKFSPEIPIYLTGHSLGGSMAAIMHARWCDDVENEKLSVHCLLESKPIQSPVSCYTFGMPRYGNAAVMTDFEVPWHVYSHGDSIPTVPPLSAGYADLPPGREYCLDPDQATISAVSPASKGDTEINPGGISRFFWRVPNHMMERYLVGMQKCCAMKDPLLDQDLRLIVEDDSISIGAVTMLKTKHQ